MVKNLPAVWETQVGSLVWEDPLEKEMATHSNILSWRIPWIEEPGELQSQFSSVAQSCPTLCDYSLPGSSIHGILQERILEEVAMPSSKGSS